MKEVQEAARDALGQLRGKKALRRAAREELHSLWHDLNRAHHYAMNGTWSIDCEAKVYRIAKLTLVLGKPAKWENVPGPLLLNGWYEELHAAIGMPTPLTAEQRAQVEKYCSLPGTYVELANPTQAAATEGTDPA